MVQLDTADADGGGQQHQQVSPPKTFTFDSAYDWNASSEAIYNDICYSLIEVRSKKKKNLQ